MITSCELNGSQIRCLRQHLKQIAKMLQEKHKGRLFVRYDPGSYFGDHNQRVSIVESRGLKWLWPMPVRATVQVLVINPMYDASPGATHRITIQSGRPLLGSCEAGELRAFTAKTGVHVYPIN
jgi:hypothetical protein